MARDHTNCVERLQEIEEHYGVNLEALYAGLEGRELTVAGEVHSSLGQKIRHDLYIVAAAYDARGLVIGRAHQDISARRFFGFQPFRLALDVPSNAMALRIVVYVVGQ